MDLLVLTISDRAANGEYEDRSGPAIKTVLEASVPTATIRMEIVPDEACSIRAAFETNADCDIIITTGGTGLSSRDLTPEVTQEFCDRMIPGIAEMLRMESLKETPFAALSRGVAGIKGKCLIINLPGSEKGASFCARCLTPLLEHACNMRDGKGH
ncbi:MAG: MogA/MoaB family molybdenum cofactor biosynthesis protein [Chitinispirillaceae bacterium]|nr:MogA/MoaB family molybdenum cofactor biosynthesis protein [Chitinispirillaceae bacterium]